MRKTVLSAFALLFLLFIQDASADMPLGAAYLEGSDSKSAMILCHGRGKHPQWLVVNPLRIGINKELGYHALSLQIPVSEKDWQEYAEDFPEAFRRIQQGIDFLQKEKGITTIYLMGHSMGSRMAAAFLAEHPDAPIFGFVGVGMRNNGGKPLSCDESLRRVNIFVLDVYGDGGNGRDEEDAGERKDMVSEKYTQVLIKGADHRFTEHEEELIKAVVKG